MKLSDTDKLGLQEGSPRGVNLCTQMRKQTDTSPVVRSSSVYLTEAVSVLKGSMVQSLAGKQENYKIAIPDEITFLLASPVSKQLATAA